MTLRLAVIGGGISGLAAAHRLTELRTQSQQPVEITLFEAGPYPGGVAGTKHIGEYLVETGADMFITSQPAGVRLCERLGLAERLMTTSTEFRGSLVLRKGRPIPVPEGFMLLSPGRILPVLTSPIFSPWGKLRMGCDLILPRGRRQPDESLADFVRRRLGREALDRLIQPLVGGIYTSDPERLSLRATLPRFLEMESQHRSLILASRRQNAGSPAESSGSGARYGLFVTLPGGISELFERLVNVLQERIHLKTGTAVRSLKKRDDGRFDVELDSGCEVFDGVIAATPAPITARFLSGLADVHPGPELRSLLTGIEYASTAIVVSGHRLADIRHPLNAFGLVIPAIEKRRVLAVSFTSRKFPGRAPAGRILLRTFVGGAMQPELLQHDDATILRIVREELRDILGVEGEPDFAEVAWHRNAMPQYHVGHVERVARIRALTALVPGLELAGNAYSGVGLPDCIQSGESAAQRLVSDLDS